jgi:uncharacterized protein (DUF885 family)
VAVIRDVAYPAFRRYGEFIQQSLGANARYSLACVDAPLGDAFYQRQIRLNTATDIDPKAAHQLGLEQVQLIHERMQDVAASAGFESDWAGFIAHLKNDPNQFAASGGALQEQIEVLARRIDGKFPEYFGHLRRSTFSIRQIPAAIAEKMPPAFARPNPADHTAAGVHWISSLPQKLPRYMQVPLALHEA